MFLEDWQHGRVEQTWALEFNRLNLNLGLSSASRVTLIKFNLQKPQFSYLQNGAINDLEGLSRKLKIRVVQNMPGPLSRHSLNSCLALTCVE